MKTRLSHLNALIWLCSLTPVTSFAQAQVPLSEFQNWASFFGRYQYMTEVCTGEKHDSIRERVFSIIDRGYPDMAMVLQVMYLAGYRMAQGGREAIHTCSEQQYQQSSTLYEQRMTQLDGDNHNATVAQAPMQTKPSSEARSCVASPPGPYRPDPGETGLAINDGGRWSPPDGGRTFGYAGARFVIDGQGQLHGWGTVHAESYRFKLYGMSQAAVAMADSQGRHVSNPHGFMGMAAYDTVMASSMGGERSTRDRKWLFRYPADCDVTYVLLKYRFCAMTENLSRRITDSNDPACFGGPDRGGRLPQNLYLNDFEETLEAVRSSELEVGQPVDIGAWKVVRLR